MNKEVLMDKRMSIMLRVEDTLGRMKSEASSYVSLVRALWSTRRSRVAFSGQGTTEYAILIGACMRGAGDCLCPQPITFFNRL